MKKRACSVVVKERGGSGIKKRYCHGIEGFTWVCYVLVEMTCLFVIDL